MTTTKRIVAAAIALLTLLPVAGAQASDAPDRAAQAARGEVDPAAADVAVLRVREGAG